MKNIIVSPSVLSADFARLGDECVSLEKCGADWIHCDVMDGSFVPNISFGLPVVKSIRSCVSVPLDVHLMINEPERYVEKFAEAGADIITFHIEATQNVSETLRLIHRCGKKAGISVKPTTPIGTLTAYRGMFDMVLVMSVEPGFGGQEYIPDSTEKIRRARQLFPNVLIEVDGGINPETSRLALDAGADALVAGSYVIGAEDRKVAMDKLRRRRSK